MFLPRAYMADDERAFRTVNKSATEQLSKMLAGTESEGLW
jgi:hypothetical protein